MVVLTAFLFLSRNENTFPVRFSTVNYRVSTPDTSASFANLFHPIKLGPTHSGYRDATGKYFPGAPPNATIWKKPLGKKLLVVDIDTRLPTGENQIFNTERKIDWEKLHYDGTGLVSGGIWSHYLYAMIHGYDYRHYHALDIPNHYSTWIKPHVLKEILPNYEFVVFLDADAVVSHLEVPLEWMFNRWGITKNTLIALAHDTEEYRNNEPISLDSLGVPVLNSGFIVIQNHNLTFEMLSAWANCTTEERYSGCARWKGEWSHEQRAFSEYIRHDPEFNTTSDSIIGIPCDDAMGFPGFKEQQEANGNKGISDCKGNFIRHYTSGKHTLKEEGTAIAMQAFMEIIQKNILKNQATTFQKERDPALVLPSEQDVELDDSVKHADVSNTESKSQADNGAMKNSGVEETENKEEDGHQENSEGGKDDLPDKNAESAIHQAQNKSEDMDAEENRDLDDV